MNKDLLTGTACTFSDGSELRLGLHTSPFPSTPAFDDGLYENNFSFTLALPELTGKFLNRGLTYSGTSAAWPAGS